MSKKAIFIIKPDAISCRQEIEIKKFVTCLGIILDNEKKVRLDEFQAKILIRKYKDEEFFNDLKDLLKSSFSICYIAHAENIEEKLKNIVGDFDPRLADGASLRKVFFNSACLFEQTPIYNTVIFSEDDDESERFLNLIYGESNG